jgi:DNA-binding FadR family transcriptional regulator
MTAADHRRILDIHRQIYQAVEARDAEAARDAMQAHMQHLARCIRKMLKRETSPRPARATVRRRR